MSMHHFTLFGAIAVVYLGGYASAEELGQKVPALRPTHAQLERDRLEVRRTSEDAVRLKEVEIGGVTRKGADQTSLVKRSTVLGFGDYWTLVPKGAVLHVPEHLRGRVDVVPSGRLLGWADFHARNRAWLRPQPVAVSQARGDELLDERIVRNYSSQSQVVVATCSNGPISMRAPSAEARVSPAASK